MNVMTVTEVVTDAQVQAKSEPQKDAAQGFASELNRASNAEAAENGEATAAQKTVRAEQPENRPEGEKDDKSKDADQAAPAPLLQAAIPVIMQAPPGQAAMQDAVQNEATVSPVQTPETAAVQTADSGAAQNALVAMIMPAEQQVQQPLQISEKTGAAATVTGTTAATVQSETNGAAQPAPEAVPAEDKAQAFAEQAMKEMGMLEKEAARQVKQPLAGETPEAAPQAPKVQAPEEQVQAKTAQPQADTQDVKVAAVALTDSDQTQDDAQDQSRSQFRFQKQDATMAAQPQPLWTTASGTAQAQFQATKAEPAVQGGVATTIIDHIATAVDKGQTELVVQLKPEHLGGLEISLKMGESGLTAKMVTSQESVQNMIHNQIAALQDTLREKGIPVVHMEVIYDQTQSSASFSHSGNSGQWTAQNGNGNDHSYKETEDSVNYYNFMSSYDILAEHGGSVEFSA